MKEMKILIVDDDKFLTRAINQLLKSHDYLTTALYSFRDAAVLSSEDYSKYDLLILDINLPDGNGVELLRFFQSMNEDIPVIMLSANTEEMTKVTSLDIGADDYICKPFSPNELVSRINAVLRRSSRIRRLSARVPQRPGVFEYKGLVIDCDNRAAMVDGAPVTLRFIEFELVRLLVSQKNSIVKTEKIIDEIWKDSTVDKKTLEPHISRIRKKLGPYGARIETVINVGYRFNAS